MSVPMDLYVEVASIVTCTLHADISPNILDFMLRNHTVTRRWILPFLYCTSPAAETWPLLT